MSPWLNDPAALPDVLTAVGDALTDLSVTPAAPVDATTRPTYPRFGDQKWYRTRSQPLAPATGGPATALTRLGERLRQFRLHHVHRSDPAKHDPEFKNIVRRFFDGDQIEAHPATIAALGLPISYNIPTKEKKDRRSAVIEPLLDSTAGPIPAVAAPGPPRPNPRLLARRTSPSAPQTPVRRASPLWLRVYRDRDGWNLRSLAFYSEWLPANVFLRIRDTRVDDGRSPQHRRTQRVTRPDQETVDGLLNKWFDFDA
ncbi:hypothetical protein AWW66_26585 [Micromonospora rosaria]|uniref:Uncharacterized protein n=1 Tax=Micromonospora rosaria TaxID=47874 RepID=A0A136PKN0_9ACTN|nr:hypothetical protein [Micromonospora rosaria]KXK59000.1 hypothetical protein AWW66_26585 [Micromonospora rosaria]